jgi:hypothetical protein
LVVTNAGRIGPGIAIIPRRKGRKSRHTSHRRTTTSQTLLMAQVCSLSDADEEDGEAEHLPQ